MGKFPKGTWIHHLPKDPGSVRNVARRLAEADFDLVIPKGWLYLNIMDYRMRT